MSICLISRQLGALKIAQRTAAPWIVSRATSAAAGGGAENPVMSTPAISLTRTNLDLSTQFFDLRRKFSTIDTSASENNINDLMDDGGPVLGASDINVKEMTNDELADMSTIPGWNLVHNPPRHNPRGALVGKVVSDKMQKTVNVAVDRYRIVPKYRKRLRYTKKFMAHDEHEVCNVGDLVMIVPCQKISRHKHFMVREIVRPKGQL